MNRREFAKIACGAAAFSQTVSVAAGLSHPFGKEAGGLALAIILPKKDYRAGEKLAAELIVQNLAAEERTIYHTDFWVNHQVLISLPNGELVELTDLGKKNAARFDPNGPRRKNIPNTLKAGETASYKSPGLEPNFRLDKAGAYRLQIIREDQVDPLKEAVRLVSGWHLFNLL